MVGPARVGVLECHIGCVETTRPRGARPGTRPGYPQFEESVGWNEKWVFLKIFGPARVCVLECHIGCVETTKPRGARPGTRARLPRVRGIGRGNDRGCLKMVGPARVGVLECHIGCVETTRPRGARPGTRARLPTSSRNRSREREGGV